MQHFKNTKKGIVLLFLTIFAFCIPTQLASATQNNQMISDECLQNPEACEDSTINEDAQSSNVGLGLWDYVKVLFSLLFVLALLVFVLRFINKRSVNYQTNSVVRNIGGISVGSQKSVQLLQIGSSLYIIGVGDDVQLIKEIDDPEEAERLLNIYNNKQSFPSNKPYISDLLKRINLNKNGETEKPKLDFENMFKKRLSEIKRERRDELEKWKEKEQDK